MRNWLLIIFMTLSLCGCAWLHVRHLPIQQGNIITEEMVKNLKPGMSQSQVVAAIGEPVLINTFRLNQLNYVYTYQKGDNPREEKHLTLYFDQGKLTHFTQN